MTNGTVRIEMAGPGKGRVFVNGNDLSMVTQRVDVSVERDIAKVVLTICPFADLEIFLDGADVTMTKAPVGS